MSDEGLRMAQEKMRGADVEETAIEVFSQHYRDLEAGATGLVPEDSIEPLTAPAQLSQQAVPEAEARLVLSRTVMIKLNGGLGTSMGMEQAKSLLPVRDGSSFLDVIVAQVAHARQAHDVPLPLILMNSFRTRRDTRSALAGYPDLVVESLPLDFVQNQEPKLLAEDLTPVRWPGDPDLEWCPPGHGDLYTAVFGSGLLQRLIDQGYRYACVSNSDNLGARPDAVLAGWFAASGAPYAAEVCGPQGRAPGHPAVRQPAHPARHRADRAGGDGLLHRRAPPPLLPHQQPGVRPAGAALGAARTKRRARAAVDPQHQDRGPGRLLVPRGLPDRERHGRDHRGVRRCAGHCGAAGALRSGQDHDDLLLVRSDVYDFGQDGFPRLVPDSPPLVRLDSAHYKKIGDFDARFPSGVPALRNARSLLVHGDWTFGADVVATGQVELPGHGAPHQVPDQTQLGTRPGTVG